MLASCSSQVSRRQTTQIQKQKMTPVRLKSLKPTNYNSVIHPYHLVHYVHFYNVYNIYSTCCENKIPQLHQYLGTTQLKFRSGQNPYSPSRTSVLQLNSQIVLLYSEIMHPLASQGPREILSYNNMICYTDCST